MGRWLLRLADLALTGFSLVAIATWLVRKPSAVPKTIGTVIALLTMGYFGFVAFAIVADNWGDWGSQLTQRPWGLVAPTVSAVIAASAAFSLARAYRRTREPHDAG